MEIHDDPGLDLPLPSVDRQMVDASRKMMTGKPWFIDLNNDVGPNDEGYWEWWEVTYEDETFCKFDRKEDAEWLCNLLNKVKAIPREEVKL